MAVRRLHGALLVVALAVLLVGVAPSQASHGPAHNHPGPDQFGYKSIHSSDPGGPTYAWNSIVGATGAIQDTSGVYSFLTVTLPFTFSYYGESFSSLRICDTGYLLLGAGTSCTWSPPTTLPSNVVPNGYLAGYWTDLLVSSGGAIWYWGSPTEFIVEWNNVPYWSGGTPPVTFQIKLYAGGSIEYIFNTVQPDAWYNALIGHESPSGTDGLRYKFGMGASGPVEANSVLRIFRNQAPVTAPDSATAYEDAGPVIIDVMANDKDPENDPFDLISVTQGKLGAVAIVGKTPNKKVEYTPKPGINTALSDPDTFTYTVRDNQGNSATGTVSVKIEPVNDPPTYKVLPLAYAYEDGPTSVAGWAYDIVVGPTPDETQSQTMQFTIEADPPGIAEFRLDADGRLHIEPLPDANGDVALTVRGKDTGGTAHGGIDEGPVRTSRVRVLAVNDPPMFLGGPPVQVAEDAANSGHKVEGWAKGMVTGPSTATDEAGQSFGFEVVGVPQGIFAERPAVSPAGTLTFRTHPDACTPLPLALDVLMHDSGGNANGGNDRSQPQPLSLHIQCTPDAPKANDDQFEVPTGAVTLLDVLANDVDPDGEALAVVHAASTRATIQDGALYYDPGDFSGLDSLTYTVSDPTGRTSTASVSLVVTCPAVRVHAHSFSVLEDGRLDVASPGLLQKATVPEGAAISILQQPQGTLSLGSGGAFSYTPPPDFAGRTTFLYEVVDGSCRGANRVTIEVIPVNDAPQPKPDQYEILDGQPRLLDVLANDRQSPDGIESLTLVSVQGAFLGTTAIEDGKVRYTPSPGSKGVDRFHYTVRDAEGLEASAEVRVNVRGPPEAPRANADAYDVLPDSTLKVHAGDGVLANDASATGPMVASLVDTTRHGVLTLSGDGGFTYQPDKGFRGRDSFVYSNGFAVADVVLTVGSGGPPVADFTYTAESVMAGVPVQFTDRSQSPDGPLRTWAWNFGDGGSSTAKDPQHAFATPGTYIVALTVRDGQGREASTSKAVEVHAAVMPAAGAGAAGRVPPLVDAGPDLMARTGQTVRLLGSAQGVMAVRWTQVDGPEVTLSDATLLDPTFTMPSFPPASPGVVTFRLDGFDRQLVEASDTVQVQLRAAADAMLDLGADRDVRPGEAVALGAHAQGVDPTRIQWRQTGGPFVLLQPDGLGGVSLIAPAQPGHAVDLEASVDGLVDSVRLRIVPERLFVAERVADGMFTFRAQVPGAQTWRVDDGEPVHDQDPAFRLQPGIHAVELTVQTPAGPMSFSQDVRVAGTAARVADASGAGAPFGLPLMLAITMLSLTVAAATILLWRRD